MPSFDDGFLFSALRLTHSQFPSKRANAPVPVVSVVVVQRAIGVDVADVVGVRRIRRNKAYPERFYPLALSRFFHAAIMYFTSTAIFDQYSQLLVEMNVISCESSMKNRSSLQYVSAFACSFCRSLYSCASLKSSSFASSAHSKISIALSCIRFTSVNLYFFGYRSVLLVIAKVCFTRSLHFTITLNSEGSCFSRSGCFIIDAPPLPYMLDRCGIIGAPVEVKAHGGNNNCSCVSRNGQSVY